MKNLPMKKKDDIEVSRKIEHPFESLHRQMNDLFEGFFRDSGSPLVQASNMLPGAGIISPKFEISETEDAFLVTAELPGMEEKDIQLEVDQNALVLSGEKKQEKEEKKKNYFYSERSYGHFHRMIPIPEGADRSKVKAKFLKGVLSVTIPKSERGKAGRKRISISPG